MNRIPEVLPAGYRAEFDGVRREDWNDLLGRFSDANLYQCWDYDAVRCGERNLSHMVLSHEEKIVAIAQVRLVRLPFVGWGAAYARWAPLWRLRESPERPESLQVALRALRNEYVCRRGLVLRVFPLLFSESGKQSGDALTSEHYLQTPNERPQRTLVLNIEAPMPELRKRLDQKWRNCLNHAERNGLSVKHGTDDAMFAEFISLYKQMLERKKFSEPNDINQFRAVQGRLPEAFKMGVFLCHENGELSAGAICSAIGATGIYLFGATNEKGMKNKGAYLLQRHALEWLKSQGCHSYNLNGINPTTNPGGYHFKVGLAGVGALDLHYVGRFDCYGGVGRRIVSRFVDRSLPPIKRMLRLARPRIRSVRGNVHTRADLVTSA